MKMCFLKLILLAILVCNVTAIHTLDRTQRDVNPKHKYGEAANILSFGSDGVKITDDNLRESILLHPEVKDRKIVVVSIVGAYRKGKSFLMDYCLRFMYANYKSIAFMDNPLNDTDNWMGDRDEPLTGFSWKAGSKAETKGIQIWSDVFLHENDSGKKIAIVLMDTQGLFNTLTPQNDEAMTFSSGILFSSVQIFNLNNVIQENQLHYFEFATNSARIAVSQSNNKTWKPYQKLVFLMRDSSYSDDYDYGYDGGREYIKKYLEINDDQTDELKSVREFLPSSFEEISCFLMPEPERFIRKRGYDGRWSEMDETFKSELFKFVKSLLSPSNLVIKKNFTKEESTSKQFNDYMKFNFGIFKLF